MKSNIEGRLTSYASSAGSRRRSGNWKAYAAVTGSALAMATSASAGIISYSGPPVTVTNSSQSGSKNATVTLAGLPQFFLEANLIGSSTASVAAGNKIGGGNFQFLEKNGLLLDLSANATVGPGKNSFALSQKEGLLAATHGAGVVGGWAGQSDQTGALDS